MSLVPLLLLDARRRTLDLLLDLDDAQWLGPKLGIVNPPAWEIGHVAWFQVWWVLRHRLGRPPLRAGADRLYDSAKVAHETRWSLPFPSREETLAYAGGVLAAVLKDAGTTEAAGGGGLYFHRLALFHEDMHGEAFFYSRQTHGYARPALSGAAPAGEAPPGGGPCPGDVGIPGGTFLLGSTLDEPFVFDNEVQAHRVEVAPFRLARAPVTQAEFAEFVEAGGYRRPALWCEAGRRWLAETEAEHPVYWSRREGGGFGRRDFDQMVPLEEHRPVLHVNWFEADAWCRWAGRRLPAEAEWEMAAACGHAPAGKDGLLPKCRFPWGDGPPSPEHAHLDGRFTGCADVGAYPAGDSASGCRQMIGNVWEWTASDFLPYPGFSAGPYAEYSQPWFGSHKVLRGGCFATRARLLRNSWRNFYTPDRRDGWCGFRTAALR